MPHIPVATVSLCGVFTFFGFQTLLWKHHPACCWSYSKLHKTLVFLFPNSQLIPKCAKAQSIVFSEVNSACLFRPIFLLFPNSRLIRLTWPCQWILQPEQHETAPNKKGTIFFQKVAASHKWQSHVKRISRELGKRKKWDESAVSCELGKRKKWDGRQAGGIYLWKANVSHGLE